MEFDIKKENFTVDNFSAENLLNTFLKNESEAEIFNFKLKILQREFTNEIELNINNLIKASKSLDDDLKKVNLLNENVSNKINEITKNKIEAKE
jgi:hypothetical protein